VSVVVLVTVTSTVTATGTLARRGHPPRPVLDRVHFVHRYAQTGDIFGIGTYIAQRYPNLYRESLTRVQETGVDWVREEFTASHFHHATNEPYHFGIYDRVIDAEHQRGMHILGLLDYNNTFAYGPDHAVMAHRHIARITADFIKYVTAVVSHYRHEVYAWQVWNEPDLGEFWKPFPFASDYARLLSESYVAIKRANPYAQVIMGGPSGRDPSRMKFIRRVVGDGARFDAISMQPYTDYPDQNFLNDISALQAFHRPIWFTEMGWAGQVGCQPCGWASQQAERLSTTYFISAISGIRKVFWYDFRDDGVRPEFPDHFGLVEWNLEAKSAYLAFQISLNYLNSATIVGVAHVTSGLVIYKFRKGSHTYFVAWNNSVYAFNGLRMKWWQDRVVAYDYQGQQFSESTRSHVLSLSLAPESVAYLAPRSFPPPLWTPPGLPIPPGHTH
jgi:hypothetical protein